MPETSRDLEFLYEIGSLRNMQRGWRQHLGVDCANDLEHTMRVVFLALILARRIGGCDENKIIKMALTHDLCETRTSDLSYVQKVYVSMDEARATKDMFAGTLLEDYADLVAEWEKRESLEAKIVKDADNLDVDMELMELDEQGHKLPTKWVTASNRVKVRNEKLYTEEAKKLWDEIHSSDPASWHMGTNKWKTDPTAGK